ncbi:hypothetical protein BDD12DRAFT_504017 [Trichophaea hybrida]|nr:hypothetical protein BDD12DRAFT_504017 [Trichophaea hybrida]
MQEINAWSRQELVIWTPGSGKEPRPTKELRDLFRGMFNYLVDHVQPVLPGAITIAKLCNFCTDFPVAGDLDFQELFKGLNQTELYTFTKALLPQRGTVSYLVGATKLDAFELSLSGFKMWMFTRLMIHPSREVLRLQKVLKTLPILHPTTGIRFPKTLPRELFPLHRDEIIVNAWQELEDEHVHTPRFAIRRARPAPTRPHTTAPAPPNMTAQYSKLGRAPPRPQYDSIIF